MSKRKREYLKYLESGQWYRLRARALDRDGYRCQLCGSTRKLRVHHLKYARDLSKVPLEWLQTLCEPCHEELHRNKRKERRERRRIKKEFPRLVWVFGAFGDKPNNRMVESF